MYQNVNAPQHGSQSVSSRPREQYFLTHDFGGTATLSETVIHAISGAANVNVSKVEQTLAQQIDPRALDQIFRPPNDTSAQSLGNLSLTVLGHTVSVYADGQIVITPQPH